ncbi:MAG: porin [Pseudomonadota bacterium]
MKKQLLCTSAIALGVAAAAPASAQDWNLDWGGFFNQHVGYADVSGTAIIPGADLDGITVHTNAEIIFTPSITLDNGLTFGINVQMEALNAGGGVDGIDESYMSISGDSFGRLDIGYENSAGYKMMVGAPGVTSMFINSPSISTYVPFSGVLPANFRQAAISSYTEVAGNNDVARITYYTPSFSGFTAGISYAPTGAFNAQNSFGINRNAVLSDIFDIGVNYSQSFGATDLTLAARWGTGDAAVGAGSDPETWGVGFNIGFSGITVGGSYAENDNGAVGGVNDQEGWSFGVTYDAAGPWSFEALTYQGEYNNTGTGGADESYEAYRIGASRDLGPGVDWDIYVAYVEAEDDGTAGTDLEGTVLGTAINLSF